MKITTYGHSILISILGLWICLFSDRLTWSWIGGILIGVGLLLARQSGREENL